MGISVGDGLLLAVMVMVLQAGGRGVGGGWCVVNAECVMGVDSSHIAPVEMALAA